MSLIPSNCPKPDLFLVPDINKDNNVDVTNYKIDDLLNLCVERDGNLQILCLYESSNLTPTIVNKIIFETDPSNNIILSINSIFDGMIATNQINYNNKVYYYYFKEGLN